MNRPGHRPSHRPVLRAALALALLAGLGACGKEGRPSVPEGEESSYTYPRVYPKPSSVVPLDDKEAPKTGEAPVHAGEINLVPSATRRTTTYDSGPIQ